MEAFADGRDVQRVDVRSIDATASGWRVEGIDADAVVVAAGTETRALLAPLGIDLPLVAEDRYLFLSDPIEERLLEPLVVAPELAFAAKQLADGRVLASDLAARGDAESGPCALAGVRSAPRSSSYCRASSTSRSLSSSPASTT